MTKQMKILLIQPEESRTKYNFEGIIENECLDLEYVSALLKELGHEVKMFDCQVEKATANSFIRKEKADVVYITGRVFQENFMLEYAQTAKETREDTVTIIGGIHAQLCADRMFKDYVDYILTSFDVYNVQKIIEESEDIDSLPGVCIRKSDGFKVNPAVPFDINRLPRPDRTYFYEHPNNYGYLEMSHAAWVRTAFCCPYRCKFCIRNRMNNGKYSARDIDDVVAEIKDIESDNIYIVDDDFLFDEERLDRFVSLVKENHIEKKYICYGRSDFIASHEDTMAKLKEIGFYYILVGLEAIDDNCLKDYNKRSSIDNNIKSIEICNRLGLNIMGMFILDLDFVPADFKKLYKWIKSHEIKHVAVSIFTPEIGMETYDEYKDRIITDNPSHFDYLHLVASPGRISVKKYYMCYYILLIKLFLKAKKDGIYDFLDYGYYIKSFIGNMFKKKRENDDE